MRHRGLQDLIRPTQFADLTLQRLQPLALVSGQPWPQPIIGLGPTDPLAQRLRRHPELVGDRGDRRPLRGVLVLVLEHQPDGTLPQPLGIPAWSCHGSNLSRVGASRNLTLLANSSLVVRVTSSALRVDGWLGRDGWRLTMSLRPNGLTQIPAETSRVARAAFPKGCLAMRARDALGPLFTDEQFAELFAARGRPAWSPARLALVLVLGVRRGPHRPAGRRRGASAAGLEVRAGPCPG
jgi:hypothetical protein